MEADFISRAASEEARVAGNMTSFMAEQANFTLST